LARTALRTQVRKSATGSLTDITPPDDQRSVGFYKALNCSLVSILPDQRPGA
jgi:hypothetical protein